MAQYLDNIDKFYFSRSARFPRQFMDDVAALLDMVTKEMIEMFSQVCKIRIAFVARLRLDKAAKKKDVFSNLHL